MNELNQTEQTLQSLAQLIALTAMQWLPARADDSQTSMIWNQDQYRLEGQPFTHNGRQLHLVIDIKAFELQFIDASNYVSAYFSPGGRTPVDAMAWWKSQMQALGVTEINPLNYHLDVDPVAPKLCMNNRPV